MPEKQIKWEDDLLVSAHVRYRLKKDIRGEDEEKLLTSELAIAIMSR